MINIKPFENSIICKTDQIEKMFDIISSQYNFINLIISLGNDIKWRKKISDIIFNYKPKNLLDLATGTGNLPIILANKIKNINILGIDISKNMIKIGKKKINFFYKNIKLIKADCQKIFFLKKNKFDIVTIVFGIRNFENINNVLKEIYRVLKKKGVLIILEFSISNNNFKYIYNIYSKYILLNIINFFTKNFFAYKYLLKSINKFSQYVNIEILLKNFNFKNINILKLTYGIVSIYIANK
ncbi:ubiquinone/menaquinone biosynthesis methyltransferase [Candidatus Karelsulcia muelleri]|uniref:Demethylmenaquinone methyltransferase n=1 Tax=Candidatus Karelsulcia muelleri PSPU TaxID=1189303 RepID=A0AAD1B055_9FLAO|nr:ubiquinone/menaquinone biosynthesis methyltransferase [Candidatus Karelsulcia muelleri]NJJ98729.1 ubiquinone/menaquinone biosynthesis methyltransferase [Candidatus Karelsulcia muelleri]BAO66381.1 ubiquinone/menaquinone biosynthesis methyltransferase [Candidatus Karelsulcia muelleri PSPU]